MITIAGLGISGSYLLKRLKNSGFDVRGYDPKPPGYYLPCGYAVNIHELAPLLEEANLSARDYLLSEAESITIGTESGGEYVFQSRGLCTIEKNRLENDMVAETRFTREIAPAKGDIIVDATGVSRYYLGKTPEDFTMYARELVTTESGHDDFYFRYFPDGKGYYWEFPLGDRYHIGVGTSDFEYLDKYLANRPRERITGRKIRLKPLMGSAVRGNIVGIGEAVGTVSPITGEGIIPSLKSAEILYQCLNRNEDREEAFRAYMKAMEKTFSRYMKLYSLLMNFRSGRKGLGNVRYLPAAVEDIRSFGIDFRMTKVISEFL